jgi:hypothetical protein
MTSISSGTRLKLFYLIVALFILVLGAVDATTSAREAPQASSITLYLITFPDQTVSNDTVICACIE